MAEHMRGMKQLSGPFSAGVSISDGHSEIKNNYQSAVQHNFHFALFYVFCTV